MTDVVIAVALIALIAACAGPRISRAGDARRLGAMVDELQRMRCRIELYRMEHDGLLPGQTAPGGEVTCDGFISALTESAGGGRAPYLKEMPVNPFVADDTADDIAIVNCMDAAPCGGESTGWWFNVATGDFRANDCGFHSAY
ncbi:MAG: hypothetical protein DRP00_06125 [Candidatus Aenigmatarchaeota archaeon]|nr:MAG: hypothetical protein DRP00_06125 [Candidatus Aenigmarchaeota archaeon]